MTHNLEQILNRAKSQTHTDDATTKLVAVTEQLIILSQELKQGITQLNSTMTHATELIESLNVTLVRQMEIIRESIVAMQKVNTTLLENATVTR